MKYILKIICLLYNIYQSHSYSQCPILNNINNCVDEYCFCPNIYDRHLIKYSNGKKCYICQPNCNNLECSLKGCYCKIGYKKAKLGKCFKCIIHI